MKPGLSRIGGTSLIRWQAALANVFAISVATGGLAAPAGTGLVESAGHVHIAPKEGTENLTLNVTYITAPADGDPVVVIKLENPSGLVTPCLDRATVLATEIYQRARVTLRWTMDETTQGDSTLTLVLTTSTAVPRGLGTDAIGVAPSPGDGTRGTMAYVFLDKVSSFAASHRLALTHLLACVMAHEIGHLLLPPNAHRPDSVMRDRWHPALFPPRAPGILGFLSTRRDYCVFAQVRSDAAGPRTRQRLCRARGACLF
jgi:hypothetical protein